MLHVCTGNICRSPLAERLMRQGLRQRLATAADEVVVESAGTAGVVGSAMDPGSATVLASYGLDGVDVRARALMREQGLAADLVHWSALPARCAVTCLRPRPRTTRWRTPTGDRRRRFVASAELIDAGLQRPLDLLTGVDLETLRQ